MATEEGQQLILKKQENLVIALMDLTAYHTLLMKLPAGFRSLQQAAQPLDQTRFRGHRLAV